MKLFSAVGINSVGLALGVLLLCGCESKAGTGALVGAGLGVGAGTLISPTPQGALIGGAVGAAAGGLVGSSLEDKNERPSHQNTPSSSSQEKEATNPLTIDDIKEMSRNGLSDNVIIGQIHATHSVFHLTTEEIIDLKNSGVSQRVIDHMIQSGNR